MPSDQIPPTPHRVAVIGLGAMGLPMATCLTKAFIVTGFDPSTDRRDLATSTAVNTRDTAADACQDADIVLLAVRDHPQAEAALFGSLGVMKSLRPGAGVILTSTVGPAAALQLGDRIGEAGHPFIDAPISGGPVRAGEGDLLIMVGASPEAVLAARPVLECLASTLTVIGQHAGDGQSLKVINQLLAGIHVAAAAEAIALARALGIDPETVIDALSHGAAGSFMFQDRGPRMVQAYTGGAEVKSRVDIFVKDMGIVSTVGHGAHVPLPLAASAHQLYLLAEGAGLGAADDSSVVTILSPPAPTGDD